MSNCHVRLFPQDCMRLGFTLRNLEDLQLDLFADSMSYPTCNMETYNFVPVSEEGTGFTDVGSITFTKVEPDVSEVGHGMENVKASAIDDIQIGDTSLVRKSSDPIVIKNIESPSVFTTDIMDIPSTAINCKDSNTNSDASEVKMETGVKLCGRNVIDNVQPKPKAPIVNGSKSDVSSTHPASSDIRSTQSSIKVIYVLSNKSPSQLTDSKCRLKKIFINPCALQKPNSELGVKKIQPLTCAADQNVKTPTCLSDAKMNQHGLKQCDVLSQETRIEPQQTRSLLRHPIKMGRFLVAKQSLPDANPTQIHLRMNKKPPNICGTQKIGNIIKKNDTLTNTFVPHKGEWNPGPGVKNKLVNPPAIKTFGNKPQVKTIVVYPSAPSAVETKGTAPLANNTVEGKPQVEKDRLVAGGCKFGLTIPILNTTSPQKVRKQPGIKDTFPPYTDENALSDKQVPISQSYHEKVGAAPAVTIIPINSGSLDHAKNQGNKMPLNVLKPNNDVNTHEDLGYQILCRQVLTYQKRSESKTKICLLNKSASQKISNVQRAKINKLDTCTPKVGNATVLGNILLAPNHIENQLEGRKNLPNLSGPQKTGSTDHRKEVHHNSSIPHHAERKLGIKKTLLNFFTPDTVGGKLGDESGLCMEELPHKPGTVQELNKLPKICHLQHAFGNRPRMKIKMRPVLQQEITKNTHSGLNCQTKNDTCILPRVTSNSTEPVLQQEATNNKNLVPRPHIEYQEKPYNSVTVIPDSSCQNYIGIIPLTSKTTEPSSTTSNDVGVNTSDAIRVEPVCAAKPFEGDSTSAVITVEPDLYDSVMDQRRSKKISCSLPEAEVLKTAKQGNKCTVCGRTMYNRRALLKHQQQHPELNQYTCDICSKRFCSLFYLKRHEYLHTKEELFKCDTCGQGFRNVKYLKCHQYKHARQKPYTCAVCGTEISCATFFAVHMRKHAEEKPFVCAVCGKRFVTRSHLEKHKNEHTIRKPYTCAVCGKGFITIQEMKGHQVKHTEGKLYQCSLCDQGFSYKSKLTLHMRKHPGNLPYNCVICDIRFSTSKEFASHQSKHNKEELFTLKTLCESQEQTWI